MVEATNEYRKVWKAEGTKIQSAIQSITGLKFVENRVSALVYEGPSRSNPLLLRASYSREIKAGTLIHELCHRILHGNSNIVRKEKVSSLKTHKQLNLILYDIWTDLYGDAFSKKNVIAESRRKAYYRTAWNWALKMNRTERHDAFVKSCS